MKKLKKRGGGMSEAGQDRLWLVSELRRVVCETHLCKGQVGIVSMICAVADRVQDADRWWEVG